MTQEQQSIDLMAAVARVQRAVVVPKAKYNAFGKFSYRSYEAWSLMEGGSSVYLNRATVENVTIIYEAMKADGYEPNAAETETYEACVARLGSEE